MKKIILDTNFLLIPYQFHVDIFSEIDRICGFSYRIYVLDKTLDELKKVSSEQGSKHRLAARLGLSFIRAKAVKKIRTWSSKDVDTLLAEMSRKDDVIIATQDKELKKRLQCPVIIMRQKTHLVLEK
ncbi:nucleotide-binding protein [Candidatus Woesearchaeota archaeon]|nr:nucleotide-binding protein [Candidatus Woesearchaeota archaeon]